MSKIFNRDLKLCGRVKSGVRILATDKDGKVLLATGTSVPTGAGYAKGCLFIKTDASTKGLYENQGTTTSASFNVIGDISASELTLADGKVFVGGASGVAAAQTLSGDVTITNAGVASVADTVIKTAKVTLTNAQIKALRSAPKTLVSAPGANKVVKFISATLKLKAGSNVLTETADNMAIKYNDGAGVAVSETIEATGFIDQAANTQTQTNALKDAIVASANAENKALVLHNTGDGEYGGNVAADATMEVYVTYRVIDTA